MLMICNRLQKLFETSKMSTLFRNIILTSVVLFCFAFLPSYYQFGNSSSKREPNGMASKLVRVDFEVFGIVQGVFFRKNTQDQAIKLGLRGWCKNTLAGTVQGQVQGPEDKVNIMKDWLQNTGSSQSRIDKAEFKNETPIDKYDFESFDVVRRKK